MAAYLGQLRRLRTFGLRAIAPGHGRLITDPDARLDGYLAHRLEREGQIEAALAAAGTATVDELVSAIYIGTPDALLPVARYSVWAHLRKLADEGRVRGDDPDEVASAWTSR
jgi:glyoxylase-like metal-dependent hydrolase (beta-lactamase superfamily II)